MSDINTAILERLEKVVDTLQENSTKMGQLLAVHNEKLDNQDRVDAVLFEKLDRISADLARETNVIKRGCERDIRLVDDRLRLMEKKMWTIAGALSVICFLVSTPGQSLLRNLTPQQSPVSMSTVVMPSIELS
jgi:hypothetical protein|tara:strand:+ start:1265 stop:1663 length:399 start_codon:yes stop_codon:yes gene_type:complete